MKWKKLSLAYHFIFQQLCMKEYKVKVTSSNRLYKKLIRDINLLIEKEKSNS